MANRKSHSANPRLQQSDSPFRKSAKQRLRRMLLENLEQRQLLAVGPQLIGVQPNASDLLFNGDVRNESPREITFRFDDAQRIDPATLQGIRITASGGDGTFGLATSASDFGSQGRANILLSSAVQGETYSIQVSNAMLGVGEPPAISTNGNTISIALNTNPASRTTADELIQAINTELAGVVTARLHGGVGSAELGLFPAAAYAPFSLSATRDQVIQPGAVLVGDAPDENEVVLRFAETLKDDAYKIEVFGFDDPNLGVLGLRNTDGELFQPTRPGTRLDTIEFRLDLGSQVLSVVPQPVVRVGDDLQQLRDTIVVYFDGDKLDVASAENPDFYQLINTADTVGTIDDLVERPTSVAYNAANNTATLTFRTDLNLLSSSPGTFRLRIGTRESAQITPTRSEAAANVISDLNTGGLVKLRFTAKQLGEAGNGVQVTFTNSGGGSPSATAVGRVISIDLGRDNLTAQELVDAIRASVAASALVSVDIEPGSDPSTVVGNTSLSFSPLELVGLGSTFDTSTNLGIIGSDSLSQTSLILSSTIDAQSFGLDLPGASNDAAHRMLPQNFGAGFEDHVNARFGADSTDGITTIYYNFQRQYSTDAAGTPLINAVTDQQQQRAREVLSLWANYIGVQFVETADLGITIATGQLNGLIPRPGTQLQQEPGLGFGVRVDPEFEQSLVIMAATTGWRAEYGDNYTRTLAAAVGMLLGLERAGDLPETTLMRLDPTFLAGSGPLLDGNDAQLNASDERYEPIFPGNQDIIHGSYLHRQDGTDIDLYRFEVDFGGADRVGFITAETQAQRMANSSSLDTNLELFRQTQASAKTDFGAGPQLSIEFEAVADGALGNQLEIRVTQTDRTNSSAPGISILPNAIGIDLNSNPAMLTTGQQIVDALQASSEASRLVKVSLVGDGSIAVGANALTQNPVVLSGGSVDLVAQNNDYFGTDSLLKQALGSGVYYIGVSASGNDDYNAVIADAGFGGKTQGDYELRLSFTAAVDATDSISDVSGPNDSSISLDGDGDGKPGGSYNFWFQTRPLLRSLTFNSGASSALEGRVVSVTGGNGVVRNFEFTTDAVVGVGRVGVVYTNGMTAGDLAIVLEDAINSRPELGVTASANGVALTLSGERAISVDPQLTLIQIEGKTIFVDKSAAPNADGSLARPFNNIAGSGVPNAFASTHPGDIVRIVGNGGLDGDESTLGDNLAYEIGLGLLPGSVLADGASMNVPRGVTAMVDAGAIFKLRQAAINVGSTNLNIDRSGSTLQVLGAPLLQDVNGNALRDANGSLVSGTVHFTSWLDENIGFDTYSPTTTPAPGDWGGISFQRDVDLSAGRADLEDDGIFLRYVNHADIRYGGGTVSIGSVPRTVNSIQMLETRPTITDNTIHFGADAAMSALPNSFQETNFNEPRFQANGAFTSDYDRVGPDLQRNRLFNNSLNGIFIRVETPADGSTVSLTVPGRLDDTDIVHLITENVIVQGAPGGTILDATTPQSELISLTPGLGGDLVPGTYNYKLTFVDRNGYESVPSNPTVNLDLSITSDAIRLAGLPGATGDFVSRKLYRSGSTGDGPYKLVADLDRSSPTFLDTLADTELAGTLARDRLEVSGIVAIPQPGGTLSGVYNYRIVMFDAIGRDGLASNATANITAPADGAIRLNELPLTLEGFAGRRIYRSSAGGSGPYVLVAELPDSTNLGTTTFTDDGSNRGSELPAESLGIKRPRIGASLVIDPGSVIKLEAARIEATFGANIIAEGDDLPIVFTSKLDDTIGAGGSFDTNNNGSANLPSPGDWGGIYLAPTSSLSADNARFAYGGGVTKIDGTFRAFNTIEIQQADVRIANSLFEDNANGFGGQGPGTRFGRLSNAQSTIFVRGSQPTLIGNTFLNNAGSAIEIDVLSMSDDLQGDEGRQTGSADQNASYVANRGPLIRGNRFDGNDLNGLEIRAGDILTSASVWDDSDIVHVVTDEIFVTNVQHEGGLRLQSAPNESLVVKFDGYGSNFNRYMGAGLSAIGELSTGKERVGGTIHILGQPGFPVILTSLFDDTVGAGLKPDGSPQTDTNNDGIGSIPQAGDWRGVLLDQYSNDRNVGIVLEVEDVSAAAPGPNGFVDSAQVLGDVASRASASNENRALGFIVEGVLSQNEDVDVYSFTGAAGTEMWLDVDYTQHGLDLVLELLDANGSLLARSDNSTAEAQDPSLIFVSNLVDPNSVNPLTTRPDTAKTTSSGEIKEDGTTNPLDPGLRVRLPGAIGSRGTFYFRVRSASLDPENFSAGLSSGSYQVQVRLREAQEWAGSSVNFADIRYATNGVHLVGLPGTSPLIGEAAEDESVDRSFTGSGEIYANNGVAVGDGITTGGFFFGPGERQVGNRPQYIGNLLDSDKGGISVAGEISNLSDVDFYRLDINQEDIVRGVGAGNASVVFDIDYADGFNRPDTSINIFREEFSPTFGLQYRLVFSGDSSNIAEDLPRPLSGNDTGELTRGSAGNRDAYIGPVALPEGTYLVGISSAAYQPRAKIITPFDVEPINSILRIADTGFQAGVTTALPPVVTDFLPQTNIGGTGELVSSPFDLGPYAAADLPAVYLDYTHGAGDFEIFMRQSNGTETLLATTAVNPNAQDLFAGTNSVKLPLVDIARNLDFSGQNGLSLVFRGTNPNTTMNRVIIGFAERGEQVGAVDEPILLNGAFLGPLAVQPTRVFSLETYSAFVDQPAVNFDYEIFNGNLDVFVVDQGGNRTRVATSVAAGAAPFEVILVAGGPQNATVDLSAWANQPGLTVSFETRNDNPTNVRVADVHIQLADGSRIGSGEPNSTYTTVPVPSTTITTGAYQLEVRMGENFFQSRSFGSPTLTKTFDTNDRFAEQITLVAPAGDVLADGDQFEISDGGTAFVFEFNSAGSVAPGNVPVAFAATDSSAAIARRIRDAINNQNVQSRLLVRAASSGGIESGPGGEDPRVNLFGNAIVRTLVAGDPAGEVQVIEHVGSGDRNIVRNQSQILIQNSFIRESRDYGIWSEPAGRLFDPRDDETTSSGFFGFFNRSLIQDKPALAGTQAVRNLPVLNDGVQGGLLPGLVIQNNVLEEGGLGGIQIQGESPIWMITPALLPVTDNDPTVNNAQNPDHFGAYLDDGDYLVIDSDRTRLHFEFEDMAGAGTGGPSFGSGEVEGNGVRPDSVPVYYREEGGTAYTRPTPTPLVAFATNGLETMHALRDAILGSIFTTNGTTQQVRATVAESLLGPDPNAPPTEDTQFYPEYYNRPAVYLEGVTNIQYINTIGFGNPFDIRPLDLGESPQPHTRVVNNTIIGTDGRASFNGESATDESNDTIADAVQTWQGTSHNPLLYSDIGVIGDGGQRLAGGTGGSSTGGTGTGGGGTFGGGGTGGFNFSEDQIIVRFQPYVSEQQRDALLAAEGLAVIKEYAFINAVLVGNQDSGELSLDVLELTDQLKSRPEIVYAEPDYLREFDRVPNDPRFPQQWGYDNQGQTGGTIDADIDLVEAWDTFTGSSDAVIAVIDSGVDYNHPDLRANMWVNQREVAGDGIDNDNNGYIDDIYGIDPADGDSDPLDLNGHGTHVAGTTAAAGNNGTGVSGVNWNAQIMALKVGPGNGPFISTAAVIESLNYMVMMKTQYGVNIVVSNNSYGGGGGSQAEQDAIQATIDVGIPFVTSAGNNGTDNDVIGHFPSNYPLDGIIAVSATDHNDQLAGFSQFGLTTVDVAAPGVDILSTTLGGGYGLNSGTSMASPHVAGVVALMAGYAPGATVQQLKSAILLGADPLANLDGTSVTGARLNAAKSLTLIGAATGAGGLLSNTDVDIYQFKLGVGERAIVDIDSEGSGLDSVLQIFDSRGIAQEFVNASGVVLTASDNDAAPGEAASLDSYADFTATQPGVYYAAVSSVGNSSYDPLSFADRKPGDTTGAYRISISARHLQDFVITAQDASAYAAGETFTIFGVPDIDSTGSSGRTFEFVFGIGGPTNPDNIPINLEATWRFPDVARAIAKAINEGDAGQPVLPNSQALPNGNFGPASPLPAVTAVPLGGLAGVIDANLNDIVGDRALFLDQFVDYDINLVNGLGFNHLSDREIERLISGPFREINQGLELFTRRNDGFLFTTTTTIGNGAPITITTSMGNLGIGHDRLSTNPSSQTSIADGTTEKFVVVKNAAYIDGNGAILVDPDQGDNHNLDQLLPETGVLATRGASPTILNNVFFNLQTPVVAEESRRFPLTGGPAPYGTNNPDEVIKPGEVIIGGSIFQYDEPGISHVRFGTGIQSGPTNVPNTALDLNFDIDDGVQLFVNGQAGNYLPSPNSPLIDSSIDTLSERPRLFDVKAAVGIAASPVLAPNFDLVGLLRVDDPNVAPPSSQGQNVFKDRGALERADFEGPTAILADPIDNDSLGIDQDKSVSVVQLESGVYRDFRIQLSIEGVAVDDNTVVNSVIQGLRQSGSVLVLFENGRRLEEGLDYTFDYNSTSDEIVLTPLAGVWKNDVVYEISINNRDRFAVVAPAGDQVSDGDIFTISDSDGGLVVYEFESGYRLQVPQGLTLQIPLAGGGFGGVADGDRFSIVIGSQRRTFEFDRNGNTLAGNIPVPFLQGASQAEMTDVVLAALQATSLPIAPVKLDDTQVFIGAAAGVRLDSNFTAIDQPATTLALKIPALGPRPGGITDGQTFSVSDGRRTITFEYDLDGSIGPNRVAIDFRSANTAADLTTLTQRALANSPLAISPEVVAADLIHIGLSTNGSAVVTGSNLELLGVARTPADGEMFTLSGNGNTVTFEFTVDSTFVSGNIPLMITLSDTQDQIADTVAAAIASANLGFSPDSVGDGNIALGGTSDNSVDVSNSPSLSLFGTPGVRSNTRLEIVGPLVLQVPSGGAGDIADNSIFSITNNGRTVNFEFDSDSSGPSAPNNQVIPYNSLSTVNSIAESMAVAISTAGLGIFAKNLGAGQVSVGNLDLNQVNVGTSSLTLIRGVVADGETFTIDNGDVAFTFEFEDVDVGNGFNLNNIPILFSFTGSTAETLAASMKAAIEGTTLGLTANVLPGGILELNATPRYTINTTNAPTLIQSGVPGGAKPVLFIQDPSFTGEDMTRAILDAIANTQDSPLVAAPRGGDTFFVENAISISPEIDSFFIRGVADLAGNLLKPNRIDDQTAFTILMPGVALDYGDAPDPLSTTAGRYATKRVNDGARHVIVANTLGVSGLPSMPVWLGSTISAELDGQPSPLADADSDDGVVFSSSLGIPGVFNRNIFTTIDVTLMNAGFVDGWIDFNADGDWDDPGEHILNSVRFTDQSLTQSFQITVPSTAPELGAATTSFARFRSSSSGGLIPTGLAVDGEVEDYAITIVPGTPPTAVDDVYPFNEDTMLSTTDADGTATPSFTVDDGIAANDTDPEGGPLGIEIVDPPAVGTFSANADGTFTYQPPANFNGPVTFTYRVNDGVLVSNNIGTVTLLVREINDAPLAVDDSLTLDEDQVLDIDQSVLIANDSAGSDPNEDGQTLVITSVESVSTQGGTVSLSAGRVIYTPPSNYSGPDEFVYTVTDNGTNGGIAAPLSSSATVFLTILDKNDPPVTAPFSISTQEDTSVLVDISAVIADDEPGPSDEASQSLQFLGVQAASSNGGQAEVVGGQIRYTPPADFVGIDTFFYEIEDNGLSGGVADPQTAIGTVSVTVTGVNDAPRVADPFGTETMQEDEGTRLLNLADVFFDPDVFTSGDTLTFQIVSNSNSTLVNPVITGSQLELQTNADQNGQSVIVVRATDSTGASVTDTLTLNVVPVNDTPRLVQALPDLTVAEDSSAPQLVLTPQYFFDPDVTLNGDVLMFAIVSNSNPLLVTPVINGGTLVMNLSPNQSGVATISVSATDADGQTISDTFNLVVTSINDVPITQADTYTVRQGQTLITTDPRGLVGGTQDDGVLANDRDPEGDAMTAILIDAPKFASSFTLNSNGTFTYSHNFSAGRAPDSFTYQASDGTGSSVVTKVTLDIGAPPPPPHQNPTEVMDVNADGFISPIDALLIINFLNNNDGDGSVGSLPPPPPYRDVNGDNFITPIDALMVINSLNGSLTSGGEGEATLGASDLASAFTYQDIVSSSTDNARIGMRVVNVENGQIYGPLRDDSVFMELGQVGQASMVDTSWLSDREADSDEAREVPVDLALAGLLGLLGDNEEA